MSRETKIKDTKRIITGFNYAEEEKLFYNVSTECCIPLSRESIRYYADEACLETCQLLYDLNIQTFYSGANVDGRENADATAFVGISYDTLSDENKCIANSLIENGIIDEIYDNKGRGEANTITISIPIRSEDLVGSVSDRLISIAKQFIQQDVLYGRTTEKAIRKRYYQKENGNFFDYITLGELTSHELEDRVFEEISKYYSDEEGNLFFTEDLLNKHLSYMESINKIR